MLGNTISITTDLFFFEYIALLNLDFVELTFLKNRLAMTHTITFDTTKSIPMDHRNGFIVARQKLIAQLMSSRTMFIANFAVLRC